MRYKIFHISILSLFLSFCSSCKKKTTLTHLDELPAITQSGANTFGCLVNREAAHTCLYKNQLAVEGTEFFNYTYNYDQMIISATTTNNNTERRFRFSIKV